MVVPLKDLDLALRMTKKNWTFPYVLTSDFRLTINTLTVKRKIVLIKVRSQALKPS